jgi:SAM-dependent methyltransferase
VTRTGSATGWGTTQTSRSRISLSSGSRHTGHPGSSPRRSRHRTGSSVSDRDHLESTPRSPRHRIGLIVIRGAVPSPNIWHHSDVYEIENLAVDREREIEHAMRLRREWDGACLLDTGCGAGFHLPRFARRATEVIGVEPSSRLVRLARTRCAGLTNVAVRRGVAQKLPLADSTVDVMHARWAYFFGPGCEPGLAEVRRVMRRGGVAFVIDNDATRSTFGAWFRRSLPAYDPASVEAFWSGQGWQRVPLDISWRFDRRSDFEAVVRIEFDPTTADRILAEHLACEVDYAVNLWWHQF